MGPITRSMTHSVEDMADATTPLTPSDQVTAPLVGALADLDDSSTVHGRQAKELRDATTEALVNVWKDARQTTSRLVQQVNQGSGENSMQFSIWLRRLEDIIRMRGVPMNSEQKANFLIGYLDGVAREKIEELSETERKNFDTIVNHLRNFFESPQQRYVARQALSACRQEPGESATNFANRLLNLVRAATAGQDPATQKERVLEEFVPRLRSDIRYFVKLDNPATFEQAVTKAQTVEQLLTEAASERLIHPTGVAQPVAEPTQRFSGAFEGRNSSTELPCFNCGGLGHMARSCPSPRRRNQTQVNFFGALREQHYETYKTVSVEHCRQMRQYHKCEQGDMQRIGDSYKTSNDLIFQWPSAPFGCCTSHKVTVTNCYLVPTVIHARHGTQSPETALGDVRHCAYRDGSCTLKDGSVLLWTPIQEEICAFIPISKMRGHLLGRVWISDSKEFALSWREDSPRILDCGNSLVITDQGYAITMIKRRSRSADPQYLQRSVERPSASASSPAAQFTGNTLSSASSAVRLDMPAIELNHYEVDAKNAWPPKVSVSPVKVMSLRGPQQFFVAQIPIKANGIAMLGLIDTGAAISVASSDLATLLGIFQLDRSGVEKAVGMAGVPITLVGYASLEFQIGNSIITETVHFTDGSCIPREADAFNIIMGNNVLSALPPWTIDYTRKTFTLDGEPVKILCMLPDETQPDGCYSPCFRDYGASARNGNIRPLPHISDASGSSDVSNADAGPPQQITSHLNSLRKVFSRFRDFDIKISGKKLTDIARTRITFLGHEITGSAYYPAERNIRAIKDFPVPKTAKEVKGFIGMANFFRKFIQNFALIAAPLYELTKDKAKFIWGSEQQAAFETLREKLTSKPCLSFPQDREFILFTDGSQVAVGAALMQQKSDEDKHLIAIGYFSKTLSDSQRKWSPTHIELFAMISALRFFKATIYGNLTRIFSDHRPLTYLLKHNKTHDNLARWVVELQSYSITIEYLKGSSNVVADCLSRMSNPKVKFQDNTPESDDIVEFPACLAVKPQCSFSVRPSHIMIVEPTAIKPYDVLLEQKADHLCQSLMSFLETGNFPDDIEEQEKTSWLKLAEACRIMKNGCLYRVTKDSNGSVTSLAPAEDAMERGSSILSESVDMSVDGAPAAPPTLTIDQLLGSDDEEDSSNEMETETIHGGDETPKPSVETFSPVISEAQNPTASRSQPGPHSLMPLPPQQEASTSSSNEAPWITVGRPFRSRGRGQITVKSRGQNTGRGRGLNRGGRGLSRGSGPGAGRGANRGGSRGTGRGGGNSREQGYRPNKDDSRKPPKIPPVTPDNFWHYLVNSHPWGNLVNPRRLRVTHLTAQNISNAMPTEVYEQIPNSGYLGYKFTKTLFPKVLIPPNGRVDEIPLIELQTLEDAVRFRYDSQQVIDGLLSGEYQRPENTREQTGPGEKPTLLIPPLINGRRPVLYQVVATNRGKSVILEAKDFLVIGPDRRDLHCIVLDQFATNAQSNKRGFDLALISMKDLIWVWDVEPTDQAIADPHNILTRSRNPRTTALDNSSIYFFRAATFAFVTPAVWSHNVLGIVISLIHRDQEVIKFRATFEGAPDAVVITPSICDFPLSQLSEDEMLLASRATINFNANPKAAKERMSHLFSVACSTLAAIKSATDDRRTHWIHAIVPEMRAYPLRISFTLTEMASESGWTKGRPAELWVDDYEIISRMDVFEKIKPGTVTDNIINIVYGGQAVEQDSEEEGIPTEQELSVTVRGRRITLTQDQRDAVALGNANHPIVALQAAFGTGKTVVGAIIAARHAMLSGKSVLVTASTNAAVAQFAETLLSIEEFSTVRVLRYVSDAAVAEERKPTQDTLADMVDIMFVVRPPDVLCITTASLLNASSDTGIFVGNWDNFTLVICDEASQVPEPVFVAIANHLPALRHVYIGDIHQLEPHVRCPRTSQAAKFGARSIIDILVSAHAVPVAPLVTTFRAHPSLNGLPNLVAYEGTLVSRTPVDQRRLLLDLMTFPDGTTPFMFLDVAGNSERAVSRSHSNEAEALVCTTIIDRLLRKGVAPEAIYIICFYKEQLRRLEEYARNANVQLGTVDSVQGREKDVVILLTTRTDFDPTSAEFLDDPRRMNVALTRCRQGQFVLGHAESLRKVNFWNVVLTWADAHNAVIPASDLGKYLSTD
ncbi:zinc knuckle [Oesophagostomum dentatum]|uniref:RNA-directed DNA polymerase n=1 Tax=Oesophagostomum dentatum TaxID=61180 RepID=A0A0B1TBM6_OESDE|nr:zinc knuckle [Oesophagostomum dentatum]